jgi:hypothetical protein
MSAAGWVAPAARAEKTMVVVRTAGKECNTRAE